MVLLGKVWAAAMPDASDAAASAVQQTRFHMVFSSVRTVRSWAAPAARQASRPLGFDSDKGGCWHCARRPRRSATLPAPRRPSPAAPRSEEHTSELQSLRHLVCRLLLEKKKKQKNS